MKYMDVTAHLGWENTIEKDFNFNKNIKGNVIEFVEAIGRQDKELSWQK